MPRPPPWSASTVPCGGAPSERRGPPRRAGLDPLDRRVRRPRGGGGRAPGPGRRRRRSPRRPRGAPPHGRAAGLDHRPHLLLRPRAPGRSRCLRAPLADRATGPSRRGAVAAGRHGGRSVHGDRRHRPGPDRCPGRAATAQAGPGARVMATDTDERAVACARANGVEAYCGDLFAPVARRLRGAGRPGGRRWCPTCRRPRWPCCSATP